MSVSWLILIFSLVVFFAVLYFSIAIPLIFYKKKEIAAFDKLANEFIFDSSLGKAGLKANFPFIKGDYNNRFFIVNKARSKNRYYLTNAATGMIWSKHVWFLEISMKLTNSKLQKIDIRSKKILKLRNFSDNFKKYFEVDIQPQYCREKILTDEIKKELIEIRKLGGVFFIVLEKNILYTNNFKGLITDKDVKICSRKIKLLSKIGDVCNSPEKLEQALGSGFTSG